MEKTKPLWVLFFGIVMPVFEVESWRVAEGKEEEHGEAMRRWLRWVNDHRELFPEWRSVRYFVKTIAGEESERHLIIWEYDSLAAFEAYKARRGDYQGPYGVQAERPLPPGGLQPSEHEGRGLEGPGAGPLDRVERYPT